MDEQKLSLPRRAVFAAILLQSAERLRAGDQGETIVDLTKKIVELKKNYYLDTSDISIRADRGGWVSDDLSSFVNRFVLFGLASQNPVRLLPQAVDRCREMIRKELKLRPAEVERLLQVLHLGSLFAEPTAARSEVGVPR